MKHKSVLLHEAINELSIKSGETVVDATTNGGGHASSLCHAIGKKGTFIGIDLDSSALARAEEALCDYSCTKHFLQGNFREIDTMLARINVQSVSRILFDLGINSDQLDSRERGFSFLHDGPLKMTFSVNTLEGQMIAHDIANNWDEENIAAILYGFADENFRGRIARAIVEARGEGEIKTTVQLAQIITRAVPKWYGEKKINPATKTFQAFRMAVNDELPSIEEGIQKGWELLASGGRIAVITFHSVEDKLVKTLFKKFSNEEGVLVNKKVIVPEREEVLNNPRSRSAKLRVIQKINS